MLRVFVRSLFLLSIVAVGADLAAAAVSPDNVWVETDSASLASGVAARTVSPGAYRTFALDRANLLALLKAAPLEFTAEARARETILSLPMPDGTYARFRVERSPIAEQALLDKFPELGETYHGQGVDDPTATVRFDFLPTGFHSMILSPKGTVMVDPYFAKGDTENYISYMKSDAPRLSDFKCDFVANQKSLRDALSPDNLLSDDLLPRPSAADVISGTQLRTYRLALAATNEYAVAVGSNTVAGTLAAQVLIMNRVNGVYERDLAIRMVTVGNNNLIVYAGDQTCAGVACTAANDPYTNNNGGTMLTENQNNLNSVIGTANYDIGHVFSTGGGGVAFLGVPCGGSKAGGVTGLTNPVGDPFAIDYVAHEMGHQWGADHTFNTTSGSCSGNRAATSAYEPGSGVTIMAYAGICTTNDLARNSIDTFHVKSLEAIVAYSQTGGGNACAQTTATGNTPPTVSVVGGPSFNIPKQTPFTLTATASDVNNDSITYDWQEYNLGASTTAVPNTDATGGARPIFRPYSPTTSGSRTFPSLTYILANANVPPSTYNCNNRATPCMTGELLPAIARTMSFQVIARDNRANGGGINTATATVVVDGVSGPFAITAPNAATTFAGNSTQTITWNVASTTAAPVNAANVKISLSTDGGQTFPTVLLASTPNDGTETVTIPNVATTTARIKVEAVGNIFFDINDANFTITASAPAVRRFIDFDGDSKTDISIFRPSATQWWYLRSSDGGNRALTFGAATDKLVPADFTGDGKTDIAFFRPSTGEWFVLRSEDNSYFSFPWGTNGDIPAPGDFDGDGKADAAVYRPSSGTWFISRSNGSGPVITNFGNSTDQPVAADYDGDGKDDIAIYRPAASEFWMLRSTAGLAVAQFGSNGDKAVQGDYTGDGKADVAVYRPTTGVWFVLRSEDNSFFSFPWGTSGDAPSPGDYDGDGKYDAAVFRPSGNTWYLNRSTAGVAITAFGATGDVSVPNAFVR